MKKFYRLVSTLLICALVAGSPVASLRAYADGVPDTEEGMCAIDFKLDRIAGGRTYGR